MTGSVGAILVSVLGGVVLTSCGPRATAESPVPAPPEPQPVAAIPVEPAIAAPVVPPDPPEQVGFELSALAFGRCRQAEGDEGPFVVGSAAEGWNEGEPLWAMTNAGGLVRAAAGKPFEYCGPGITQPTGAAPAEGDEACVKAVTIVTEAPLRCDEPLGHGAARPYTVDAGAPLDYVFAFHRRYTPPTPVRMRFAVRVHAVCQDPDKDFDEPGAMIPVTDPPAPIDAQFARQIAGLGKQRWRAVQVDFDKDANEPPLHVLHAAEHQRKVKVGRWSVLREQAGGAASELVAKPDRSWPDSFLLRDHQCGLPFSLPLPALAFTHAQRLHWVTVEDAHAKIVARVWEVGDGLRRALVLPVALASPKW